MCNPKPFQWRGAGSLDRHADGAEVVEEPANPVEVGLFGAVRIMADAKDIAHGGERILCGSGAVGASLNLGRGPGALDLGTPAEPGGHRAARLRDLPALASFAFESVEKRGQQLVGHGIGDGRRDSQKVAHPTDIERSVFLPRNSAAKQVLPELRQNAFRFAVTGPGNPYRCNVLSDNGLTFLTLLYVRSYNIPNTANRIVGSLGGR